jgi:hypothetical protein
VVDETGGHSVLTRNTGLMKKELEAYMAGVPLDSLPTIDEAKALQKAAAQARNSAASSTDGAAEGERQGVEASKFLPAAKEKQPAAAPQQAEPPPFDKLDQIRVLKQWSDGAQAFKNAVEQAGYTLAHGKRGYVVIDEEGTVTALSKVLRMNAIRTDAFMSPLPLASLPTVEEVFEARKKGVAPEKREIAPKIDKVPPEPKDVYLQALELATQKRFQEDTEKLAQLHQYQLRQKEVELDRAIAAKMDELKTKHQEQIQAFRDERKKEREGLKGFLDALLSRLNPTLAAEKAQAREKERQNFVRRLAKERADLLTLHQQDKQLDIDALRERQIRETRELKTKTEQDLARHIREHQESQRIREQVQRDERERERQRRDGPEPPTRVR